MWKTWRQVLTQPGGFGEVWQLAVPLILGSAGNAINMFVDRMMLTYHSELTMAAAFPAGLTSWSLGCFFVGAVGYVNSFVAQYYGAKMYQRVGVAVWQGIFMALGGGVIMTLIGLAGQPIFAAFGHDAELQKLEVIYFRIFSCGTVIFFLNQALCAFWGGRGQTRFVMFIVLLVTACNVPLNYLLIFGRRWVLPGWGEVVIPELGIAGAAYGTVASSGVGLVILLAAFWRRENREIFGTLHVWDWPLFKRLLRYGSPNGVQLFLDLTAFNIFVILQGKISEVALAASGIAFAINTLSFTPMIGLGEAAAILVGQGVGANDIPYARRSVRTSFIMITIYMVIMGIIFLFFPEPLLALFKITTPEVMSTTRTMLKFICGYLLFDGVFLIFSNAIKGAGDTKFAMWISIVMSWCAYALPCTAVYYGFQLEAVKNYFGAHRTDYCLWSLWSICVFYMISGGMVFYWRYRQGKWQQMRVIEQPGLPSGKSESLN